MAKGPFSIGAVLLVAGIADHAYAAPKAALCSSGIGEFGQALDPALAKDCSTYTTLEHAVGWLIGVGIALLALGILSFIIQAGVLGVAASRSKSAPGRTATTRAKATAPRPSQPSQASPPPAPSGPTAPGPTAPDWPAAPGSAPTHAPFGTTGQPHKPNSGS